MIDHIVICVCMVYACAVEMMTTPPLLTVILLFFHLVLTSDLCWSSRESHSVKIATYSYFYDFLYSKQVQNSKTLWAKPQHLVARQPKI